VSDSRWRCESVQRHMFGALPMQDFFKIGSRMKRPIVAAKGMEKVYYLENTRIAVLRGIDLHVEKGDFLAIMGASGSGKSTLLNIIGCLDHPSAGTYQLDGLDVAKSSDRDLSRLRSRCLGFVFQTFKMQRVAIARALAVRPKLILADEPTGNLDSRTGREIMRLFKQLHSQGSTIILVTHDRQVASYAESCITIHDGRITDV
jgi:putative ABC transport system ATP-binding protein